MFLQGLATMIMEGFYTMLTNSDEEFREGRQALLALLCKLLQERIMADELKLLLRLHLSLQAPLVGTLLC